MTFHRRQFAYAELAEHTSHQSGCFRSQPLEAIFRIGDGHPKIISRPKPSHGLAAGIRHAGAPRPTPSAFQAPGVRGGAAAGSRYMRSRQAGSRCIPSLGTNPKRR
jgi:hypothetical protein